SGAQAGGRADRPRDRDHEIGYARPMRKVVLLLIVAAAPGARADEKQWVEPEKIVVPHLSWTNTTDLHNGPDGGTTRARVDVTDLELKRNRITRTWIAEGGKWKVSGEGKTWHHADAGGCSSSEGTVYLGSGSFSN